MQTAGTNWLARKVMWTVALLGCVWLPGCIRNRGRELEQTRAATATMTDELPADKEGSLTVSLRALLVTGKTDRPLLENETLHAGDHLYFLLRTSQPAYLYVVLFGPDGKSSVLFPRGTEGKARVAARCPVRIPAQGSFYLQSPSGLQDLRVVASAEPLPLADRRLCEQLQLPCQSTVAEPPPVCPPEQQRALFSAVKVATAASKGEGGAPAVASLRMQLRQEP